MTWRRRFDGPSGGMERATRGAVAYPSSGRAMLFERLAGDDSTRKQILDRRTLDTQEGLGEVTDTGEQDLGQQPGVLEHPQFTQLMGSIPGKGMRGRPNRLGIIHDGDVLVVDVHVTLGKVMIGWDLLLDDPP